MRKLARPIEAGHLVAITALLWLAPAWAHAQSDAVDSPAAGSTRTDMEELAGQRLERLTTLAISGNRDAQFRLGGLYAQGEGVPLDDEEAVMWWRKAAEQGHAHAQNELGAALAEGRGIDQDSKQAAVWYRRAAEQGLSVAQANLGTMYFEGKGVGKNARQAVRWYRLAAEQGLGWAQYFLGDAHVEGLGVTVNLRKAAEWYRKAAGQDYTQAQYTLGVLGRRYRGLVAVRGDNSREAYPEYWLARASQAGHEPARRYLATMVTQSTKRELAGDVAIMAQADASAAVVRMADGKEQAIELMAPDGIFRRREWVAVYLEEGDTMGFVRAEHLRGK